MAATLETEKLIETLREIIQENPKWFKSFIKEIIQDVSDNDPEFELLLKRNFDKYDQTFKPYSCIRNAMNTSFGADESFFLKAKTLSGFNPDQ